MKISVLVPTKNEPLINKLIEEIHRVLKKFRHEIIVIDKSDVKPEIKNAKLVIQKSDGLGNAILEGLSYASGNIIVTMDGDFSHNPNDIPGLIKKIDDYDIVIGSRFIPGGKTEDKIYRKFVSFLSRKFTSFILDLNVEDSMSGFVAVRKNVYENLKLNPIGFKINMEIMFKAKKKNYTFCEAPISFYRRKTGKTKAGLKEAFRLFRYIFGLKLGLR